jgi:hypothetical protein
MVPKMPFIISHYHMVSKNNFHHLFSLHGRCNHFHHPCTTHAVATFFMNFRMTAVSKNLSIVSFPQAHGHLLLDDISLFTSSDRTFICQTLPAARST